jgi:tetratricopeptide (TPR) repeat protein
VIGIKDFSATNNLHQLPRIIPGVLLAWLALFSAGCGEGGWFSHDIPRLGTAGHYTEARLQFLKGRSGSMEKAIADLQSIVKDEPTYKDSLTLLGRAYYNQGSYEASRQIIQRALRVNNEDEVAWMTLGMAQLRLGDDQKGIETLQGAVTLVSKVSKPGYRGYDDWDAKGLVRSYISRTVVELRKGIDAKPSLLRTCEGLLGRMDDEEYFQNTVGRSVRQRQDTR